MPKKHQIKFNDIIKALKKKEFKNGKLYIQQKRGTGIRCEYFNHNNKTKIPNEMWVMHESKYIHKGDLKKIENKLNISIEKLLKEIGVNIHK